MPIDRMILASSSPRRIELLQQMGLSFEVYPSNTPEPMPKQGEDPAAYVQRASAHKAASVLEALQDPEVWILAADTVVVQDQKILGKPTDKDDALRILKQLSGRDHEVITGIAIYHGNKGIRDLSAERTQVWFHAATDAQLRGYIQTKEPMDKAGAYGIQGKGAWFIKRIDGCYFNVVGLPLHHMFQRLETLGAGTYF
ncbi:MAG: septum formation protein Maf [Myxococcales bacterium]|nr:septum formation protein Maf [Myxococcales bacterium]